MALSKSSIAVFFLCTIFLLPLQGQSPQNSPRKSQKGIVTGVKHFASLRQFPKVKSPRLVRVPKGASIVVFSKNIPSQDRGRMRAKYPLWAKIRYKNQQGFMAARFVSPLAPPVDVLRIAYNSALPYQEMGPQLFRPRRLLLTFDDGPRLDVTEELLDLLKKYNIRGVFFVNGYNLRTLTRKNRLDIVKRIYREGHLVCNHTDRHRNLSKISFAERQKEIVNCSAEIRKAFHSFGVSWNPLLFRFPSGAYRHKKGLDLRKEIHKTYKMMICAPTRIYGQDWQKSKDSDFILKKLKQTTLQQNRGIVMIHELPKSLVALKGYIPWALRRGYRFVRLQAKGPVKAPAPKPNNAVKLPKVNITHSLKRTKYHKLYYKWGQQYGVDWRLLKAIAIVESDERAPLVNAFGYTGLFQIGKSVLGWFNKKTGTKWTRVSLKDPDRNTRIGAWLTRNNYRTLARPGVFGTQFLKDPANLAVAIYCAHNYGIGLVKRTMEAHRKAKKPMTFWWVFREIEKAGKKRYGNKAGSAKMRVAKKVGALYLALRKKLGFQP